MKESESKPSAPVPGLTESAFGRYGLELHRFLLRRLARPADADDLAQEVYLRLLRRNHDEPVRNPRAYVYRIAAHVVAEFRSRSQMTEDVVKFDSDFLERLGEHGGNAFQTDELAERLHLQRQIERALAELPPTHQAVFLLHKRDGHSHEEIARALNLSPHTVEKYLIQAKARLRTMSWDR